MGGKNSTLSDIIKILYVGSCPELIPDIEQFSTGRHFQNGHHNTAKIQHFLISSKFDMWVDNDVPNWFPTLKISTGRHFQNGHHNTAQIQHCSISTKFHMLVDYNDVRNWFQTLQNFYRSPFSNWPPQYCKKSSSEFVTMQSVHLNLLSVASLGDFIIVRL